MNRLILILIAAGGLYMALLAGSQNQPMAIAGLGLAFICGCIAMVIHMKERRKSF